MINMQKSALIETISKPKNKKIKPANVTGVKPI